jgi:urease accessory protein
MNDAGSDEGRRPGAAAGLRGAWAGRRFGGQVADAGRAESDAVRNLGCRGQQRDMGLAPVAGEMIAGRGESAWIAADRIGGDDDAAARRKHRAGVAKIEEREGKDDQRQKRILPELTSPDAGFVHAGIYSSPREACLRQMCPAALIGAALPEKQEDVCRGREAEGEFFMRAIASLLVALLVLVPTAAFAHPGHGPEIGLMAGFLHPLTGSDHILCMVAVGVFAVVLGGRALWLVPLSFVGMMVVGFLLGAGGVNLPYVELTIGLSSVVIGAVAAWGRPMPVGAAMALVGTFAIFHGGAHGAEMPHDAGGLEFALGFVAATGLLHLSGIASAVGVAELAGRYGRPVARIAGVAFALGGAGVLAGWL